MEQKQITLEAMYRAIQNIQRELHEIKEIIVEDEEELTGEAKHQLEKARKTPISEYIDHEEVVKEFSDDEE